jgi:hypothetical protein
MGTFTNTKDCDREPCAEDQIREVHGFYECEHGTLSVDKKELGRTIARTAT